jgi:protein tyrosine/serine phosphatase
MASLTTKYVCLLMLAVLFSVTFAIAGVSHPAAAISIEGVPNLYLVTTNFYRSAQPTAAGFRHIIRQRRIQTVIDLRYYDLWDRALTAGLSVRVHEVPMGPLDTAFYIKTDKVLEALRVLRLSTKKGPTLLHCENGSDRTGLITALYRVIYENWTPDEAIAEMLQPRFGFHYWYWLSIVGYIRSPTNISFLKQQLGITSARTSQ